MAATGKHTVTTFLERMSAGDIDGAFVLVAEEATWFSLSTRQHVPARDMRTAIEHVFGSMLDGPIRQRVLLMTAEDDRVAVVSEGSAVTRDGVAYENMYHFLFELDGEGRIRSIWEFNDTAHVYAVLRRGPGGTLGLPTE